MKEFIQKKAILGVFLLMLCFVYIKSEPVNNLKENINENEIVYKNN